MRHLESNGLVLAAEAAGQRDEVVRSDGGSMSEVGRRDTFYVAVVRGGYEGKYFGFELGPGVFGEASEKTVTRRRRVWSPR